MTNRSAHQAGLAFGGFLGLWHLLWAVLVAAGLAQPLIDFVFRIHMIEPVYKIMPFSFVTAAGLVIFTAILGYVVGYVLATIWNAVQKGS